MRYAIRQGIVRGEGGYLVTIFRELSKRGFWTPVQCLAGKWDTIDEAGAMLEKLSAMGCPSARIVRILSPAESRAKFAAGKLRERAEALLAMPEAQHPETGNVYDRGVAYGLRCAARLLNAEADALWPGKRGG